MGFNNSISIQDRGPAYSYTLRKYGAGRGDLAQHGRAGPLVKFRRRFAVLQPGLERQDIDDDIKQPLKVVPVLVGA